MDTAIWGLIGTLVGGLISGASQLIVHRLSATDRKITEQRLAADQSREQRKLAYLRLLLAARQLRYQARSAPTVDKEQVDALRSELSTANYEIELIAEPDVAGCAGRVRRMTLDYLNAANSKADTVNEARLAARQAVAEFIEVAKLDLGVAKLA